MFDEFPNIAFQNELSDTLRTVWNGMRRLPYDDGEVADAFASVAVLPSVQGSRGYRNSTIK